ncbi:deoxynucleoside kinase [Sulfurivermis fontis]|jgi:deoxyadenosine/deoxycytidine kinase|uniref:deoxynucleoside kinase n=1 Tax=Sulfurivermis fontis TaxID=1972068 RepID=UPI000FDB9C1B|nr:deoxynucleoside kinase [Sulfurivermis fontis]
MTRPLRLDATADQQSAPRFIVVEGPIGVGKTTLARRLAETFGSELMLEGADENPFLERFYQDPRSAALPTQLFFLFQRARQLQSWRQGDMFAPVRVADFLMQKDRLFAQLTLDDDELRLYEQAYEHLTLDAPLPDLVIYLQAPVEVLLERIARRSRSYERQLSADYLRRVAEAYTQFFYQYDQTPLLIVNAAEINLAQGDADYAQLLEQVRSMRSGRHYFNPLPLKL